MFCGVGSQKGAAHKEEEIGLEKKETEKIKDKRTTIGTLV